MPLVFDDYEVKEMAVFLISPEEAGRAAAPPWNLLVSGDTSTGSVTISESTVCCGDQKLAHVPLLASGSRSV